MIGFVVLCLFSANFMHILAVPLPQFEYPPAIVCGPCCVPCAVASDNNAGYYVGDVYPYYSNDVEPTANYPVVYGVDPNAAQIDPFYQPMVYTGNSEPAAYPNVPPNDSNSDSASFDANMDPGVGNVLDNPMETSVRSKLTELVEEYGDCEADFTNAVNEFMSRMGNKNTT